MENLSENLPIAKSNNLPGINNIIDSVELVFNNLDIAETTKKDYLYRVPYFVEFIKSNGFNINTYLEYKKHLRDRKDIATATKNKYLISAKVFLNDLIRVGQIPDITKNIKGFKDDKKHKKFGLTDKEINKVKRYIKSLNNTKENTRTKAFFSLLYLQGMRQIELIRLEVKDLNLAKGVAYVQGKGRDSKEMVHLHIKTVEILREYIKVNNLSSGYLFNSFSNRNKGKGIETRTIKNVMKAIFNKLNIDNSVHGFRHTFTTALIKAFSGDLTKVKKMTRHRQIETVMVYNDDLELKADLPIYQKAFSY